MHRERINALDIRLSEVDRKLPTRVRSGDYAPWCGVEGLRVWLRTIQLREAGTLTDADVARFRAFVENAIRYRQAGVPAGERFPEEWMERRRWHEWAAKNGIRFTSDGQPVQMMPDDPD